VHPGAPEALVDAVLDFLPSQPEGASCWDLYGGVGLFAAFLGEAVGVTGSVVTVESDRAATELARHNLSDLPQVRVVTGRVEHAIADLADPAIVVLDPPRSGAGRALCEAIAARSPDVIVYVACDPAALGRDVATLVELGYRLAGLRAFDAFPQTHHVECVAQFLPDGP
jgi:tRNA/tmRNA/rRNA uracil-C5-methylase (TrmA/RlmC/RlmD family)